MQQFYRATQINYNLIVPTYILLTYKMTYFLHYPTKYLYEIKKRKETHFLSFPESLLLIYII